MGGGQTAAGFTRAGQTHEKTPHGGGESWGGGGGGKGAPEEVAGEVCPT